LVDSVNKNSKTVKNDLIRLWTAVLSFAMKNRYYISTGALNNFYTLRYTFEEATSRSVGDGLPPEIGSVTRDYHVRNLSIDRAEAIAKAKAITGHDLSAAFDVLPIGERRSFDGDWSIFRAGKYAGLSIHEVAEKDRDYLIFMIENGYGGERYEKTLELAKALVAHELEARADSRSKAATRAEIRTARAIKLLAASAGILREFYAPGFAHSIAETLESGSLPIGRGYNITLDMIAKTYGRRNSKAYEAAMEEHGRKFDIVEKLK
jgi:hypothetical protein